MSTYAQVKIKCDNCGKNFNISKCYLKRKRLHRFCCKKCEGEFRSYKNSPEHWEGGHISISNGYRYISYNGRQIEEHRLVMMKNLGRELTKNETVHHINSEHMKLHNNQRRTIKQCARCGREFNVLHGRGLCATCYHYILINHRLNEYETKSKI